MTSQKLHLKLLLPDEYLNQAVALMRRAKRRVFLIGLVIDEDTATRPLIDEIIAAAKRGVNVHVAADFLSFQSARSRADSMSRQPKSLKRVSKLAAEFKKAGVKFRWLGRDSSFPLFANRTHSKWCVIDDVVFSFGGVNINVDHFLNQVDFMFRAENRDLADAFCAEHLRIEKTDKNHKPIRSHALAFGDDTVFFDGDFYNNSLIYRRVMELSKAAREITFVSQYCPTGKLNRILRDRGAAVYFNQPKNTSWQNKLIIRFGQITGGLENLYSRPKYLHAKFMIFVMPDGSKRAITGSHNFFQIASIVGTRENALETGDPKIISQLERFLRDYVA